MPLDLFPPKASQCTNIVRQLATPLKEFHYEPSSHPLVVFFFWSDIILKVFDKCSKRKEEHITATCRHSDMLPAVWKWKALEWEPLTMVNVFSWIPSKSFQTGRMLKSKKRPGGLQGLPEAGSVHKHQPEDKAQSHSLIISCEMLKLSHVWFSHYYKCPQRWRWYQEIRCPSKNFSRYVIWSPANAWVYQKLPKEDCPCLQQCTKKHTLRCRLWDTADLG